MSLKVGSLKRLIKLLKPGKPVQGNKKVQFANVRDKKRDSTTNSTNIETYKNIFRHFKATHLKM